MPRGLLGCRPEQIYIASTGKIGVPIDMAKMQAELDAAHDALIRNDWDTAARAIMTTDRFPKALALAPEIGGTAVTLQGISKGNMMIAPSMATTLSFLFTDARLPGKAMHPALAAAAAGTYNMISVDTTQSTNDTMLLFATGAGPKHAGVDGGGGDGAALRDFRAKLETLLGHLSQQILEDGRRDGILDPHPCARRSDARRGAPYRLPSARFPDGAKDGGRGRETRARPHHRLGRHVDGNGRPGPPHARHRRPHRLPRRRLHRRLRGAEVGLHERRQAGHRD